MHLFIPVLFQLSVRYSLCTAVGVDLIKVELLDAPIGGINLDGIFIGASQTQDMRNGMMVAVASFIVISIYLTKYFGNHGLWLSLLLFMVLRSLTLKYFFKKILRKF